MRAQQRRRLNETLLIKCNCRIVSQDDKASYKQRRFTTTRFNTPYLTSSYFLNGSLLGIQELDLLLQSRLLVLERLQL